MANLGNLYFSLGLKDMTDADWKKIVDKLEKRGAKLGFTVDANKLNAEITQALNSRQYKIDLSVAVKDNELEAAISRAYSRVANMSGVTTQTKPSTEAALMRANTYAKAQAARAEAYANAQDKLAESYEKLGKARSKYFSSKEQREDIYNVYRIESNNKRTTAYASSQAELQRSRKALADLREARLRDVEATRQQREENRNLANGMSDVERIAGQVRNQLLNVFSIYALERFVTGLYTIGGEFQKQQIALETIIGDSERAEIIFKRIKDLSIESPFQFKELMSYTKQLSAFSIPYEELYDTTKRLADLSAGLGVDMGRIILAYGQVRSAEVLKGTELRQFTEAGIPLVSALADEFTKLEGRVVSAGEVFDKISNREVSFGMVKDVLWDMTNEGGQFYQMQERLSESLAGKWSNLQDAWDVMMADIADSNNSVLAGSLDMLTRMMSHWQDITRAIGPVVSAYGAYRVAVLASNAAQSAFLSIQKTQFLLNLARTMQGLTTVTKAQTVAQMALNAVTKINPWGLLASAIAGVAVVLWNMREETVKAEEVISNYNMEIEKQSEKMLEMENSARRYVEAMHQANSSMSERRHAYEELQKLYPSLFKNMSYEQALLEGEAELYNKVARAAQTATRVQARINLERAYEKQIAAEKYLDYAEQRTLSGGGSLEDDTPFLRNARERKKAADQMVEEAKKRYVSALNDTRKAGEAQLQAWRRRANELSGQLGVSFTPKDDESYTDYLERVKKEIGDLESSIGKLNPDNEFSKETLDAYTKQLSALKKIYSELGGSIEKSEAGSTKDPVADKWKERIQLIEKAIQYYDKYAELEGKEAASKRVLGDSDYSDISEFIRIEGGLDNPERIWEEVLKRLGNTEEQRKLALDVGFKIKNEDINGVKKQIGDALSNVERHIEDTTKKWNLFKGILESTGDKELSFAVAFGEPFRESLAEFEDMIRTSFDDAMRGQGLSYTFDSLEENGTDDVPKEVAKLYEEATKKIDDFREKEKEQLAEILKDYQTNREKIVAIEQNAAEKIAAVRKQMNEGTISKQKGESLIGGIQADADYEKFTLSTDYLKFFSSIYSLTRDEAQKIGEAIRLNLDKRLQEGTLSAKDYAKEIKQIREQLEKLNGLQSGFGQFFEGGLNGLFQNKYDQGESKFTQGAIDYQKAAEDYADAIVKGDKAAEETALSNMASAEAMKTAGSNAMQGAQGAMSGVGVIDTVVHGINGTIRGIADASDKIKGMMDALGMDTGLDTGIGKFSAGMSIFAEASQNATDAWDSLKSGNIGGVISGVVGSFTSWITGFARLHDAKLQEIIEDSEMRLKELQNVYDMVEIALERTLGSGKDLKLVDAEKDLEELDRLNGKIDDIRSKGKIDIVDLYNLQEYTKEAEKLQKRADAYEAGGAYGYNRQLLEEQYAELEKQRQAELDKKKTDESKVLDYDQQLAELRDQITYYAQDIAEELYGIDLKGWASQLGDALYEAWQQGEDGAEAFRKKSGEIIGDVMNEILKMQLLEPMMQEISDYLFGTDEEREANGGKGGAFGTDFELDTEEAKGLAEKFADMADVNDAYIEAMNALEPYLNALGMSMKDTEESTSGGLSAEVGKITEEQANLLASYVNAIRADVSIERSMLEKFLGKDFPNMSVIAQAQLRQLETIASNTGSNAESAAEILEILQRNVNGTNKFHI